MNYNKDYENDTHKKFDEGLDKLLFEKPDTKPTKSALADYLGFDKSYLKADGKIHWHLLVIERCRIATDEWIKQKVKKAQRKTSQNKSIKAKYEKKIEKIDQEKEDLKQKLNQSRQNELYLYELVRKVQMENEKLKKRTLPDLSANVADWKNLDI